VGVTGDLTTSSGVKYVSNCTQCPFILGITTAEKKHQSMVQKTRLPGAVTAGADRSLVVTKVSAVRD